MPVLDLHHVTIKSKNLDETVRFYTDVIGMRQVERPNFSFSGAWLQMGETMIHIISGDVAKTDHADYNYSQGYSPLDHISIRATGFDDMRQTLIDRGCQWRQGHPTWQSKDFRNARLWQLFVLDPSGVAIELNYEADAEPAGSIGPTDQNVIDTGRFRTA
jgi:catechol 2,3-dioxygenase-like lactoylglutathione lyase family enzyme